MDTDIAIPYLYSSILDCPWVYPFGTYGYTCLVGPEPRVQLRGHARDARHGLPRPLPGATPLPLLQGWHHAGHRLPGLVPLGLAQGQHPPLGIAAGGMARETCRPSWP